MGVTARGPILIVDDDPSIREMLADLLTDEGYEVVLAVDGLDALDCVREHRPALIVLDMLMPRMDGLDFAQAYHAMPRPHAPIILLSASQNHAGTQPAAQIGARIVINKPFDLARLLRAIDTVFNEQAGASGPGLEDSKRRPQGSPLTGGRQPSRNYF